MGIELCTAQHSTAQHSTAQHSTAQYCNYIVTHKKYNYPNIQGYIPIQVGKALSNSDLNIISDDIGENISSLNPYFCELTALYWIWKNSRADIIGLSHYRRYFIEQVSKSEFRILSPDTVLDFFSKNPNGIILSAPISEDKPIREKYAECHHLEDWIKVKEIITRCSPDYLSSFEAVESYYSASYFHMFITSRDILNKYCEWLFPILFELYNSIDLTQKDNYQKRAVAFIAERLLNVFVHKNDSVLEKKYLYVYNLETKRVGL